MSNQPTVEGKCPACGSSLFLGEGGYVTCTFTKCPDPSAPSDLLTRDPRGSLSWFQRECWEIAEEKGFHEEDRSRAKVLALIHSEVSEALEADRNGDEENYAEEMADIVIRVLDHCGSEGIDLEAEILAKMETNRGRAYKHGKEY